MNNAHFKPTDGTVWHKKRPIVQNVNIDIDVIKGNNNTINNNTNNNTVNNTTSIKNAQNVQVSQSGNITQNNNTATTQIQTAADNCATTRIIQGPKQLRQKKCCSIRNPSLSVGIFQASTALQKGPDPRYYPFALTSFTAMYADQLARLNRVKDQNLRLCSSNDCNSPYGPYGPINTSSQPFCLK